MRFQTKVDTWLAACLSIGILVSFVGPLAIVTGSLLRQRQLPWILLIPVAIWILALAATMPQYYELRRDGLLIRQGWRKALINYRDLRSVRPVESGWSAAVYSSSRVHIEAEARSFLIAPKDRSRFLNELAKRAPQLTPG